MKKIEKYPITFVIKSEDNISDISKKLKIDALNTYPVSAVVDRYLSCIEEIINIPKLMECFEDVEHRGLMMSVLDEIVLQSKDEFNYFEGNE